MISMFEKKTPASKYVTCLYQRDVVTYFPNQFTVLIIILQLVQRAI